MKRFERLIFVLVIISLFLCQKGNKETHAYSLESEAESSQQSPQIESQIERLWPLFLSSPRRGPTWNRIVSFYAESNRLDELLKRIESEKSKISSVQYALALGLFWEYLHNWQKAAAAFRSGVEHCSSAETEVLGVIGHIYLSEALLHLGQIDESVLILENAMLLEKRGQLKPNRGDYRFLLQTSFLLASIMQDSAKLDSIRQQWRQMFPEEANFLGGVRDVQYRQKYEETLRVLVEILLANSFSNQISPKDRSSLILKAEQFQNQLFQLTQNNIDRDQLFKLSIQSNQLKRATKLFWQQILLRRRLSDQLGDIDQMLSREQYIPVRQILDFFAIHESENWQLPFRRLAVASYMKEPQIAARVQIFRQETASDDNKTFFVSKSPTISDNPTVSDNLTTPNNEIEANTEDYFDSNWWQLPRRKSDWKEHNRNSKAENKNESPKNEQTAIENLENSEMSPDFQETDFGLDFISGKHDESDIKNHRQFLKTLFREHLLLHFPAEMMQVSDSSFPEKDEKLEVIPPPKPFFDGGSEKNARFLSLGWLLKEAILMDIINCEKVFSKNDPLSNSVLRRTIEELRRELPINQPNTKWERKRLELLLLDFLTLDLGDCANEIIDRSVNLEESFHFLSEIQKNSEK
ncbi:MAG: hypothetical protein ACRCUY_07795 [Thermoguttaceae bacterium]